MLFKIRKAIRSDKFEKCLFIFGLLFMFYGIIRIFINPPIQKLIIFIIFFILIITLIMLNCLEKIKREVFDEDIDKRFLKILNSARIHSWERIKYHCYYFFTRVVKYIRFRNWKINIFLWWIYIYSKIITKYS